MNYYVKEGLAIRDAIMEDVSTVAENMRKSDVDEIWKSDMALPLNALEMSFSRSQTCLTATLNDTPVCITGVVPVTLLSEYGTIWMLGTGEMDMHKTSVAKLSRAVVKYLLSKYIFLFNYVSIENVRTIKWLKFCGAKFYDPEPYGPFKHPFRCFTLSRS